MKPVATLVGLTGVSLLCFALYPFLGVSFFPRTDPGQFVINLKAPSGTRVELTENYVKQVEDIIHEVVPPHELQIIVSNIGITTDFSAIYTPNSASHTAFVQVSLKEGHKTGSYEYMKRVRAQLSQKLPQLSTYFQSGGLVDAVINLGLPAPIDVQVSGNNLNQVYATAAKIAAPARGLNTVSDVLIPQDIDYPALELDVDREKAGLLGLSQKEIVDNVITALTSNSMIAPNYWIDPKSGNPYLLTVQYPEAAVKSMTDLKQIPLRGVHSTQPTFLDSVVKVKTIPSPTEVDHYQLFRVVDVYISPKNQDLGGVASQIEHILKDTELPEGVRVNLRGSVQGMRASFQSFGIGLILSVVLVYLILVAQFASWQDPFIILLAIPPGLAGVLLALLATGTTLNVMSLMGLVMMVGIVVSNSILIVEFARHLHHDGKPIHEAVSVASRLRLRPILMTSLATVLGLIPMAARHRGGQRTVRSSGTRDHRRFAGFRGGHGISGSRRLHDRASQGREDRGGTLVKRSVLPALLLYTVCCPSYAQTQSNTPDPAPSPMGTPLTLAQAEALALKNNPQITIGKLRALEAQQYVREMRSALLPTAFLSLTGVDSRSGSRIAAGALNNPSVFPRAAAGATVTQLITDFGRTTNMLSSSEFQAKAEDKNAAATAADITLAVDQAFYNSLETRELVKVAQQTLNARQTFVDKIQALTSAKLKSDLDLSFAKVDVARAKLLVLESSKQLPNLARSAFGHSRLSG